MPAKKAPASNKQKANQATGKALRLPVPTRISNDVDTMLEPTLADKFKVISLVPTGQTDVAKGILVLAHTPDSKDPKVEVVTWSTTLGHLLRLIQAMVNGWHSGTTLSGDGSCKYVLEHADEALKAVPNFSKYDIFMVPSGRAGAAKYRISVQEMVAQLKARGTTIVSNVSDYGVTQGKERTKKSESAPEITAVL